MTAFRVRNPHYEARARASFERQNFLQMMGAKLVLLEPGAADLEIKHRDDLMQQHGYYHAGVSATLADTAAGYAGLALFPADRGVLTSEFKINLLNPAQGEKLIARGRVIKSGRTLTICRSDVFAQTGGEEIHVATCLVTLMAVEGVEG